MTPTTQPAPHPAEDAGRITLTAFFDTAEAAERARSGLALLGLPHGEPGGSTHNSGGSLLDRLAAFFVSDSDRHVYAEGVRRGGSLLTVSQLSEMQVEAALDVLEEEAIDIDARATAWRAEGWTGPQAGEVLPDGVRGTTRDAAYTNPREGNESAELDETYEGASMLSGTSREAPRTRRARVYRGGEVG
ncbi:hypothetical protein FAZ78_19685 [Cereibacter changlensis]|uniref:Uncharacterized protein n=1 Tax=Cereibacter changlensis TaxID=402884 RepID=A0A4U0YR01_9RHOB|nr:hypothetical protein [Cereibacter changlensis]TKA94912.1 hypothetical protein FAZ78_19685 [Cereibacter changlensis]